jgi:hypothetical protein
MRLASRSYPGYRRRRAELPSDWRTSRRLCYPESMRERHIEYHKDGSIHAHGNMVDGVPDGYWEWFLLDGTRMRSGYFDHGTQVGEWITYDRRGEVYKVTTMSAPQTPPA